MKAVMSVAVLIALCVSGCDQEDPAPSTPKGETDTTGKEITDQTVEVGCASCMYEMPGVDGCKLAAKIGDTPTLVTGADVDLHENKLCDMTKQAVVTGKVGADGFAATKVEVQ